MVPPDFDPYALQRFVDAQNPILEQVLQELEHGHKATHWMWFVFPQLAGLGHSATAEYFAVRSRDEAAAYLAHALLGERLRACTGLVLSHKNRALFDIFGSPDDLKFRSCMTLFDAVQPNDLFHSCLHAFCGGMPDAQTLALL